jgi:hypothetical protein
MLSLWGVLCALEASPELHEWLHNDAQEPGHTCLITQLHQHTLLAVFAAPFIPVGLLLATDQAGLEHFQFFPSYDYRVSPSRAPPVSFLLRSV